ncbi:MFS transporter [Gottfriedia sp. NPDC057991]|uniref:MFS transporter n=1 Tax=Gottfriedia sp. NPDC057991 TaxID=3346298 RepID=UPI0036D99FF7
METQKDYRLSSSDQDLSSIEIGHVFERMPLTSQHWKAGFALFFTFVIEAWEMMIMVFISSMIAADFGLNNVETGEIIGSIFLGMIPGTLVWGKLVDKYGRKQSIITSLILYGILSLISAFSTSFEMLYITRFLSGAVFSGVLVATFPYFSELLPSKSRGTVAVYLASGWPIGTLIALGITLLFNHLSWHWILAISSLGGLWFLVVKKLVPESPYWLAEKNRTDDAKEVILKLSENKLEPFINDKKIIISQVTRGSVLDIFKGKLLKTTVLQVVINFCFSWGYWALFSWMPYMLAESKGFSFVSSLGFVLVSALVQFPGYIAASYLTGKFGRKKVMSVFVTLAAIGGFGFALSSTVTELLIYLAILSFFSLGSWGVWDVWMGELYPTNIRGISYSLGASAQRVANWIAPTAIGALLALKTSFFVTNGIIASFLVITAIATLFLHETEGQTLN